MGCYQVHPRRHYEVTGTDFLHWHKARDKEAVALAEQRSWGFQSWGTDLSVGGRLGLARMEFGHSRINRRFVRERSSKGVRQWRQDRSVLQKNGSRFYSEALRLGSSLEFFDLRLRSECDCTGWHGEEGLPEGLARRTSGDECHGRWLEASEIDGSRVVRAR